MVELKNLPPSSLNQPSIQTASTSAPAALPLPPPGRPTAPGHSGPLLAILDIREWLSVCVLQQPEQRERKNHGSCQLDRTHWRVTGDKEEGERGFFGWFGNASFDFVREHYTTPSTRWTSKGRRKNFFGSRCTKLSKFCGAQEVERDTFLFCGPRKPKSLLFSLFVGRRPNGVCQHW